MNHLNKCFSVLHSILEISYFSSSTETRNYFNELMDWILCIEPFV